MVIPKEFDEIRPYTPEELPAAYDALLSDPQFTAVLAQLFPGVDPNFVPAKPISRCRKL